MDGSKQAAPDARAIAGAAIVVRTLKTLGGRFDSPEARVQLTAIGLQESGFAAHEQRGGPAHSFWQFELSGIKAVMAHPASRALAAAICAAHGIKADATAVYAAMLTDDVLGCAFARLLLWTDVHPLPAVTDAYGGWTYYVRNWGPGKPRPDDWPKNHAAAVAALASIPE